MSADPIRVLFVDDDPNVLAALRRMLHSFRERWRPAFANGGAEALAALEREPFDVVVSDVRMPGMTGFELLEHVRERFPGVVRIALTGQSGREQVLPTVRPTQQFLAKPCDAETLRAVVERAVRLKRQLGAPGLQEIVGSVETLPTLPRLYAELEAELRRPEPSVRRAAALVARDIGMSAKVLQLVNSAFFAPARRVNSVERAVAMLGLDTLRTLVLGAHVFEQFRPDRASGFQPEPLWHHSLHTAAISRKIVGDLGGGEEDEGAALTAGLLHGAGKLLFARYSPARFREVLEAIRRGASDCEAEFEVFGVTHAEAGAYLLGLWGLPDPIVEAVAWHHHPIAHDHESPVLLATHLADVVSVAILGANGERALERAKQLLAPGIEGRSDLMDRLPNWVAAAEEGVAA